MLVQSDGKSRQMRTMTIMMVLMIAILIMNNNQMKLFFAAIRFSINRFAFKWLISSIQIEIERFDLCEHDKGEDRPIRSN